MTLKKRNALKRVTKFLSLVSLYRLFSIFLNTIKRNKLNILLTEYRKISLTATEIHRNSRF